MVIDTGDNSPVAVSQPRYGMHETPIMEHAINKTGHVKKRPHGKDVKKIKLR